MTKKHVWIIRAAALWTFYVWAVLVRNMVIDHTNSLAFRVVHIGLAIISFAFAAATWWVSNLISKKIKLSGLELGSKNEVDVADSAL